MATFSKQLMRIAIGSSIFTGYESCEITLSPPSFLSFTYVNESFTNFNEEVTYHITITDLSSNRLYYFNADDDEDFSSYPESLKYFIAMRLSPNSDNGLQAFLNSYLNDQEFANLSYQAASSLKKISKSQQKKEGFVVFDFLYASELMETIRFIQQHYSQDEDGCKCVAINSNLIHFYAFAFVNDGLINKANREMAVRNANHGKEVMVKYPFELPIAEETRIKNLFPALWLPSSYERSAPEDVKSVLYSSSSSIYKTDIKRLDETTAKGVQLYLNDNLINFGLWYVSIYPPVD
jgi:hypothetical protein